SRIADRDIRLSARRLRACLLACAVASPALLPRHRRAADLRSRRGSVGARRGRRSGRDIFPHLDDVVRLRRRGAARPLPRLRRPAGAADGAAAEMTTMRSIVLIALAAAATPVAAQAQYASAQPAPLDPYAVQPGEPYAIEVAPGTYVIKRPAQTRAYPYVSCGQACETP